MQYEIIEEKQGNFIKVPLEDWEDMQLGLAASKVLQALKAGEEEIIPSAFADRLMDGENPVKIYRELRGLSQVDLASKASLTQAMISEIERGKREGSLVTMARIAAALDVSIDDLA